MNPLGVDLVILSANEHWLYLDFWPMASYAYRTAFPGVRVLLVFLSERHDDDPFVTQLREYGEVVVVAPVRDIPQAAQTKMVRYWHAARQGSAVCYIDDIDWIPIDREWHADKVAQRKPGSLLLVGQEVYGAGHDGQAPASQMTAEGDVFRALFNPDDLEFPSYLKSLGGRSERHQDIYSRVNHEGMESTTDQERLPGRYLFSDEALIVALRQECPVPVTSARRGYEPGKDTIDRACWESLDLVKLARGGYIGAHTGRPWADCIAGNDAIVDYIRRRYAGDHLPSPITRGAKTDPDMTFQPHLTASDGSGMSREAFEWICQNVRTGDSIMELGSGHTSTNYLSRYYWMLSFEHDLKYVNIYPSHYVYAPLVGDWYDIGLAKFGLSHRRLIPARGPRRKFSLTIIDGPTRDGRLDGFLRNAALFDLTAPILVDRVSPGERTGVAALASCAGREPRWHGQFAVI